MTKFFQHLFLFSFLLYFVVIAPIQAAAITCDIKIIIEDILQSIDSTFTALAKEPDIAQSDLSLVDTLFTKLLNNQPYYISLKRSNSKGILLNEISKIKSSNKIFTDISEQDWYRIPSQSKIPYYGPIYRKGKKGRSMWSIPLIIEKSGGTLKFIGALAVVIDITNLLQDLKTKYNSPSRCVYNNTVFFNFNWKDSFPFTEYPILLNRNILFTVQRIDDNSQLTTEIKPPSTSTEDSGRKSVLTLSKTRQITQGKPPENNKKKNVQKTEQQSKANRHPRKQNPLKVLIIILLLGLASIPIILLIRKYLSSKEKRVAILKKPNTIDEGIIIFDEKERQRIEEQESERVRNLVIDEIKEEIGNHIVKSEINDIITDEKEKIRKKIYHRIQTEEGKKIEESVTLELREFHKNELNKAIYQQVDHEYRDTFTKNILEKLNQEIEEEVRNKETEAITNRSIRTITDEIYAALRHEHEQEYTEKARKKLQTEITDNIIDSELENITKEVRDTIKENLRREIERTEKDTIKAKIRNILITELQEKIIKNEHAELYERAKKKVSSDVYNSISLNESNKIQETEKARLTEQIKKDLNNSERNSILKREREIIRQDIIAILRNTEYESILNEERTILQEKIKSELKINEYSNIEDEQYRNIREEVRNQIRQNEVETITAEIRKEIRELIVIQVEKNEKDQIYLTQKNKLIEDIKDNIKENELEKLKTQIFDDIVTKEKARIREYDLPEIIAIEKKRLAEEEFSKLQKEVIVQIHEKERINIEEKVKKEIYAETAADIETKLKEEINESMVKSLRLEKKAMEAKIMSEYRQYLQKEYHYVIGIVKNMDNSLNGIEALDSLRQTVARLLDEKNQYKFFNLDAAQTESLVEYLQRLQGNFDTYFVNLESTLSVLKTKVNTILGSLGDTKSVF